MARRIFAPPPLKQFVREETLPGNQIQSDDELLDYARRAGSTCYHASCTCVIDRPRGAALIKLRRAIEWRASERGRG